MPRHDPRLPVLGETVGGGDEGVARVAGVEDVLLLALLKLRLARVGLPPQPLELPLKIEFRVKNIVSGLSETLLFLSSQTKDQF